MNDRERLDTAFAELRDFGFRTATDGCCQTCVFAELERDGPLTRWCFYNDQDAENFDPDGNIELGQRIWLSWGADDDEPAPILAAIRASGLDATAPVSAAERISVGRRTPIVHVPPRDLGEAPAA